MGPSMYKSKAVNVTNRNPEWVVLLDQGEILAHQALIALVCFMLSF